MNKEDKELLLKDLCARLPYNVIVKWNKNDNPFIPDGKLTINNLKEVISPFYNVMPYLRSMSSMTEEEKEELKQISNDYLDEWENAKTSLERWKLDAKVSYKRAMFYNSHHIDWNDLISKDLAIAVTEENNPYKE